MKRLLQISFDTLLTSALPIVMWIVLGIIVRPEVANVFSLTYPLLFVYVVFVNVFAIGPNITARRNKNRYVVFSNMIFGGIVAGLVTLFLVLNVDTYITLMNMESEVYHDFCIYGIVLIFYGFIVQMISQKLYYEGKNRRSNVINVFFNIVNFSLIIVLPNITDEKTAILMTMIIDAVVLIYFLKRNFKKTKIQLCLISNIKNTSFSILDNLGMSVFYGIGFWNTFSYGQKYIDAINFESLTTESQWDVLDSLSTTSKIDITKRKFSYRKSLKEAYKFLFVLFLTIIIMNVALYWYYKPDLGVLAILLAVQVVDMLIRPLVIFRWNYLQIEDNKAKHNAAFLGIRLVTILTSFIPTAYCTYIGQLLTVGLEYLYAKVKCRKVRLFKLKRGRLY